MSNSGARSVDEYEKLNRVGEGTYGTVYRARDKKTNEIVALKKVRIHSAKEGFPKTAAREIRILKAVAHPNIVKLNEVVCSRDTFFLVFEYCEHDVAALLDNMEKPFSRSEVKCILLQLLTAVEHLHANFIIHRDIKLSNLLLTNRGEVKLADFGLARDFCNPPKPYTTNVVTLWYRGPELLLGTSVYTPALDIWATGCIFGELLYHKPLLPGKDEQEQIHRICNLLGTPSPRIWPDIVKLPSYATTSFPENQYNNLQVRFPQETQACLDLLNKFLTFNPDKRITASQALVSMYFEERPRPQQPAGMPTWKEHRNQGKPEVVKRVFSSKSLLDVVIAKRARNSSVF